MEYFNPRSPCGERQLFGVLLPHIAQISIHALLAESDGPRPPVTPGSSHFNPRSPCGERPLSVLQKTFSGYFNPRSPCGERRVIATVGVYFTVNFNPRSPCGERLLNSTIFSSAFLFQSTLSLRRATAAMELKVAEMKISIHALLAESDSLILPTWFFSSLFQSTLSLRRATGVHRRGPVRPPISIHALLAESDSKYHQIGPIVSV